MAKVTKEFKKTISQRIGPFLKDGVQKEYAKSLGMTEQQFSEKLKAQKTGFNIQEIRDLILILKSEGIEVSSDYLLGLNKNKTTDYSLQFICDYTGLSEGAVYTLHALNTYGEDIDNKAINKSPIEMIDFLLKCLLFAKGG